MASDALYSTIATISGAWITILFTLGSVLITYILERNTIYFTSMRKELGELLDAHKKLQHITYLQGHVGKCVYPVEEARDKWLELLNRMQKKGKEIDSRSPPGSSAWVVEDMRQLLAYYPYPDKPDSTFEYIEKLGGFNNKYTEWVAEYEKIVDYRKLDETYSLLTQVVVPLGTIEKQALNKVRDTQTLLEAINAAIDEIRKLQTDYAPIIEVKRKMPLTKPIFVLIIFFGVLIPMYMLIPVEYHINILPEYIVILLIIGSNFLLYGAAYRIVEPIVKLVLTM